MDARVGRVATTRTLASARVGMSAMLAKRSQNRIFFLTECMGFS
jgi:hypothetical protein